MSPFSWLRIGYLEPVPKRAETDKVYDIITLAVSQQRKTPGVSWVCSEHRCPWATFAEAVGHPPRVSRLRR